MVRGNGRRWGWGDKVGSGRMGCGWGMGMEVGVGDEIVGKDRGWRGEVGMG